MHADIKHSIIHQFYTSNGQIGLRLAPAILAINDQVGLLINELREVYNAKPSKGYARFLTLEDTVESAQLSDFPQQLAHWRGAHLDFVEFSQIAAKLLHNQLQHYGILETGFLLVGSYYERGQDFLLVAFLPSKDGVSIAADLSVDRSSQLDLSRVQLAATINLTDWHDNPMSASYISFIKGRVGRKVSDFFLDFLGCAEAVDAKQQSHRLLESVQQFAQQQAMPEQQAKFLRKSVYDICDAKWQQGEPLSIKDLSEQLQQQIPQTTSFADFTATASTALAHEFAMDRTILRKLVKFQGQGGGISIGFDQQLLGERVVYDVHTDRLTIHGTPPNLRDQLRRFFGIDS